MPPTADNLRVHSRPVPHGGLGLPVTSQGPLQRPFSPAATAPDSESRSAHSPNLSLQRGLRVGEDRPQPFKLLMAGELDYDIATALGVLANIDFGAQGAS